MTREKTILPQSCSAHERELYVWFLCSCTSPTFSRRFLEFLVALINEYDLLTVALECGILLVRTHDE